MRFEDGERMYWTDRNRNGYGFTPYRGNSIRYRDIDAARAEGEGLMRSWDRIESFEVEEFPPPPPLKSAT